VPRNGNQPRILPSENRYQFVDNLSWVTGWRAGVQPLDHLPRTGHAESLYATVERRHRTGAYQQDHLDRVENGGKQWYDGLAVQLNQRFTGSGSSAYALSSPKGLYNGAYSNDKGNGLLTLASGQPNYESVSFSSTTNVSNLQAFTGSLDGLGGDSHYRRLPGRHQRPAGRGGPAFRVVGCGNIRFVPQ
jgi:hypothetical protein